MRTLSMHRYCGVMLGTATALLSFQAFAQEEAAPAGDESSAMNGSTSSSEPVASSGDDEMFTGTRFRWGISALGGPFVGGYSGGVGGLNTRFGAQISRQLGVYGQPVLLAGAGAVVTNGVASSATGLALWGVGVLPEMTFGDFFYVGLGPEVLIGGLASTTAAGAASADAGAFFSLAGRAGFALGSYKPERRSAFTIGLDFHMIFASDVVVTPLIALGYDAY